MGLVQREIEAAGITTIILANIPDLPISVSAPRVVGIEYPFGQQLGKPGGVEGQKAVLCGVLDALLEIDTPGEVVNLPPNWPEDDDTRTRPRITADRHPLDEAPLTNPKIDQETNLGNLEKLKHIDSTKKAHL